MSAAKKRLLVRAGIITLKATLIVAAVVIVGSLSYIAIQYFSHPVENTVVNTGNQNQPTDGNIPAGSTNTAPTNTSVKSTTHTIKGFFAAVVDAWRPNKKAYAMSNGRTLREYEYNLPTGPVPGAEVFQISDEIETTNSNANTNIAVNTNTVANTNAANINGVVNQNGNTNVPTNNNVNPAANTNHVLNQNNNVNAAANANTNVNQNQNVNIATNSNVNATVNTNTTSNTNVAINATVNAPANLNTNAATINTNSATPVTAATTEVISRQDWYRQVPNGKAFLKVNWFCSAALTHLTDLTRGQNQALGDFTGDCTNSNVSVKGNFVPQALGEFTPAKPLKFTIASEHQWLGNANHNTDEAGLCAVDYIKNAGVAGVYAAQYTCDDGYSFPRTVYTNVNGQNVRVPADLNNRPITNTSTIAVQPDDIQFTIYIFPDSWQSPANPIDLLTTADQNSDDDGDGLTYTKELATSTNPNNSDTDYDGLGDFEEINKYQTNPVKADTDNDTFKDGVEIAGGFNPLGAGKATAAQLAAWQTAPNQPGKTAITDVKATYKNGMLTVTWSVKPNADGIVNWGLDTNYGQHISDYPFIGSHQISFPVTRGRIVHYALRSCTPAPNSVCTVTTDLTYDVPAE
jgi:hypothetical protein